MPTSIGFLDITLAFLGLFFLKRFLAQKNLSPLPPGPKGLPLVGNALAMPSEREWLTFAKWGETWGDICSVTVFGRPLIILNSAALAIDMLDKKSAIYSDRPVLQMGGELMGWKNGLGLVRYGDFFRSQRRLFHQLLGNKANMRKFLPIEEVETHRFLQRLLKTPEDFVAHIRQTAGAIILRISYGYEVKAEGDRFVKLVDTAMNEFSTATAPGAFLVDVLPILRHVPEWFPGAGFKKKAKVWAQDLVEMIDQPYEYVKQQMAAGTAEKSFTSTLIEKKVVERDIKWTAGSMYAGGADTTVASINAFFLAMALHPEVQAKAQAEIDTVIGNDRIPVFGDREHLPYINALVLEVFRWHSVAPTAIPHLVMEDDTHNGYRIPKGSIVIANVWKMTHDPQTYIDPMTFNPARFLPSEGMKPERDPRDMCFGFGRRNCPGKILAEASVFITCAMTLAVFDISKCIENGVVVEPINEQTTGTVSHPVPYTCSIKPRSAKAVDLIHSDLDMSVF